VFGKMLDVFSGYNPGTRDITVFASLKQRCMLAIQIRFGAAGSPLKRVD